MDNVTLYNLLQVQSFDSNRSKILENIKNSILEIPSDYIPTILNTFSYDSGKVSALNILINKINFNYVDTVPILKTMAYDSGKISALEILAKLNHIPQSHLVPIFCVMAYDSGRNNATNIIMNQPHKSNMLNYKNTSHIEPINLEILSKSFSNTNNFIETAKKLGFKDEELEEYTILNMKDQENVCYISNGNCTINGISINTNSMGPNSSVTINDTIITKNKNGYISVQTRNSGNIISNYFTI
jgi:hypothetical protein